MIERDFWCRFEISLDLVIASNLLHGWILKMVFLRYRFENLDVSQKKIGGICKHKRGNQCQEPPKKRDFMQSWDFTSHGSQYKAVVFVLQKIIMY